MDVKKLFSAGKNRRAKEGSRGTAVQYDGFGPILKEFNGGWMVDVRLGQLCGGDGASVECFPNWGLRREGPSGLSGFIVDVHRCWESRGVAFGPG